MSTAISIHKISSYCAALVGLAVCLVVPQIKAQAADVDPFITVNRSLYDLNEAFDDLIVQPISRGYDVVIPGFGKRGVSNFLNNLDDVNVVFNDLLQLKIKNALQDSSRLLINSTLGIGGGLLMWHPTLACIKMMKILARHWVIGGYLLVPM